MQREVEEVERRVRDRVAQEGLVDDKQNGQADTGANLERHEGGSGTDADDAAAAMPAAETPRSTA